ncbi:family F xylanase [Apiospora arundinis]
MSSHPDQFLVGSILGKQWMQGELPPLMPAVPPTEDADWDSSVVVHGDWMLVPAERRHSGWDSVEQGWGGSRSTTRQNPAPAQVQAEERNETDMTANDLGKLQPNLSLPAPELEPDFRMILELSDASATVATGGNFKKYTTFTNGVWSGRLGSGTVIARDQEAMDMTIGSSLATQVESKYRLKTGDEPPAVIDCRTRGFLTAPAQIMEDLRDSDKSRTIDPRRYRYRVFITMRTADARYAAKVNTSMWVGTCLWGVAKVIYDAYRVM